MLQRFFLISTLLAGCIQATYSFEKMQYYPVRDRMEVTTLDGSWLFRMEEESEWRFLRVPGNWETQGVKVPEYGRDLSRKTGIYKRTFEWKEEWNGRDLILRLDAVQFGFIVYINGQKVGSGHSAHTMHQFNITPYVREKQQNEIEIHVCSHSDYWLFDVCDAWSFTGIKSSVELFSVAREGSLSDVIFTSKVHPDNSADVAVRVIANGGYRVTASLLDERYNHVCDLQETLTEGEAEMTAHVPHPKLWTAETPVLYRLQVRLFDAEGKQLQSIREKVGIREVRVENCKILLNNREIFLRGACLSENDAIEGSAMSPLNRRRQLQQMKDANINFIRTAHYPLDPVVMRLCDEMGFYVCNEIPFASRGNEYLKSDPNVGVELKARAKATIDRDRNCPSIIMWSFGNENRIYPVQDSVLLFVKGYDPSRLRGVPQMKGEFITSIKNPSKFVDVICGHYANDGVLADAVKYSNLPIINTEFAHSLGTSFGEMEHKYAIYRREPKIAGGAVWCYQDQSVLTCNFNQQNQVLKGVRIDSLRYIDNYGLNPIPKGASEKRKEGADGMVYGDGYPQEDYFLLAQVYTPVHIRPDCRFTGTEVTVEVENRFDFISLHGYSIRWQLNHWRKALQDGTVWLSAKAGATETVSIPLTETSSNDLVLCMQVLRPNGSLCYERNITLKQETDYAQMIENADGDRKPAWLKSALKDGFKLRVGRPLTIGLDYRRKDLWYPYILVPTDLKVKKQKGAYRMTCRWKKEEETTRHYIDGEIWLTPSKDGTVKIEYTLTPSDSIGGKMLDYGLTWEMPADYTHVAWLGQGPFSQTPDKKAHNNHAVWQLHKDDIRFYGNRAEVSILAVSSPTENLILGTQGGNILFEKKGGHILLTDNLMVGTYGTKYLSPKGKDAKKLGQRTGNITLKCGSKELLKAIFGTLSTPNPEQPYLEEYGK